MTGSVPIEFYKCQSAEEVLVRLDGPRPISAVLADAAAPGVDRDLLRGGACKTPVLVITSPGNGSARDWIALGAAGQLQDGFEPQGLVDALTAVAVRLERPTHVPGDPAGKEAVRRRPLGLLVAITGPGGTGASTVAAALAQGIAKGRRQRRDKQCLPGPVVLADLALRADQAMLHDTYDPLVTVQELVDSCRTARADGDMVRRHCAHVEERGYDLLIGLRRPRAWAALRPRAVTVAIDGLRDTYGTVVADITGDFEGESDTGSIDVEERNALARTALRSAACVVVVGGSGMSGTHRLVRLVHDAVAAGVVPARVLPVVNRAPRSARVRAHLTSAVAQLCDLPEGRPAPPLFLPERSVDDAFRDSAALPAPLPSLLAQATASVIARAPMMPAAEQLAMHEARLVRPGSFGRFTDEPDKSEGVDES
jgi:hypothetical protein